MHEQRPQTREADRKLTFPRIYSIPDRGDGQEPRKHDGRIIHRDPRDGQNGGHAEQDQLEADPAQGDNVDDGADDGPTVPHGLGDL